jgi:hypothetical protein
LGEDVIPYTDAKTQWKTVKKERLNPFVYPKKFRNSDLDEVEEQFWQLLSKYL